MRRPAWRLMAFVATSAVLAASCSTSTPNSAGKQSKTDQVSVPPSTTTTISRRTTITGVYGNGSSITGNTGIGTNTGQGLALPGTLDTPGATSTTAGGGPTTTIATIDPNVVSMTGTGPVSNTTPPQFRVTRTGRVVHRKATLSPTISKFRPQSSPVGASVMIFGKRLSHATAVAFDGIRATIISDSSTRIRVVVPTGATTGPISVVTGGGSVTVSGFVVD